MFPNNSNNVGCYFLGGRGGVMQYSWVVWEEAGLPMLFSIFPPVVQSA